MRKPLTRQNSTRDKRRYSAYQNRIFFYLVTLVTAPLLLLGVLSSVVYYRQTVTRSDALLASARENVETQMEIALSNLRAYYSAVVSTDNYQTLCQKTVPPYSEYTLVRDMQTAMRGGNLVDKYVEGYTYINLRSGWILSNNGMYRLADAANRLSEWAEQHAAMMWVNRTDQPTPALADTPLNTVDLTGELLVLRSSSYRTGSYAVLIVKLDLSPLYEMTESWQTGGYSIAARDFTGKTVLSTSAALTALLDADTHAEGGCVLGGWRLNSGKMGVNGLTYYAALPQRIAQRFRCLEQQIIRTAIQHPQPQRTQAVQQNGALLRNKRLYPRHIGGLVQRRQPRRLCKAGNCPRLPGGLHLIQKGDVAAQAVAQPHPGHAVQLCKGLQDDEVLACQKLFGRQHLTFRQKVQKALVYHQQRTAAFALAQQRLYQR